MATSLYFPPTQNGLQKQLDAQLDEAATTVTLNNVTGIQNKPGTFVVNRIDSDGTLLSSSVREFISYTGTSGSTLVGLTRALGGSTDQDHAIGSIVEFVPDITFAQAIINKLTGTDTVALEDTNGNEMLKTSTTTSAVNEFTIKNAATGNGPELQATGGDTNIDLVLQPKGTGAAVVKGTSTSAAEVRLNEDTDSGTNYIGLKAPASVGTSKTFTLPDADGSAGQFLKTNGSAALSWGTGGSTDGWIDGSAYTWTYASASTFTIAGVDLTTTFTKGTRLKFTQTTVKYAVVVSSSFSTDTTVTIAVNTDYTIANAAITAPYYSYQANPQGYPTFFNYTPSLTNITLGNGTLAFKFSMVGGLVFVTGKFVFGSTSSITGSPMQFAPPITVSTDTNSFYQATGQIEDSGTGEFLAILAQENGTLISLNATSTGSTYAGRTYTSSTVPMTWTTNDAFRVYYRYEI